MQSFLKIGEFESCISMLSDSDDIALDYIQPDLIKGADDENQISLSSMLCMIRAQALEKLSIDQRALWWLERSLIFDPKNIQAFDSIIKRRSNTVDKLKLFLSKELTFNEDEAWIRFYYECKINEMATECQSIHKMDELLQSNEANSLILGASNDLKIIRANCLLNLNLFRESYAM